MPPAGFSAQAAVAAMRRKSQRQGKCPIQRACAFNAAKFSGTSNHIFPQKLSRPSAPADASETSTCLDAGAATDKRSRDICT